MRYEPLVAVLAVFLTSAAVFAVDLSNPVEILNKMSSFGSSELPPPGTTTIIAPVKRINLNDVFDMNISISTSDSVYAAQFDLSFNNALIDVLNATEGNFLKQDSSQTYPVITINNTSGKIIFADTRIITQTGVTGNGTLLAITARAKAYGTTALGLSNIKVADPNINPLLAGGANGSVVINRPPVLQTIGNKNINENTTLTFQVNATDPDADPLNYSCTNLPVNATFTPATRIFSWKPGFEQAGNYTVSCMVTDGLANDSETFTITVINVNRRPVLNPIGNRTVNENQSLTFVISGSDPDNDVLAFSATNLPSGATFDPSTRAFNWTPTFDQAGTYFVTFTATDGSLNTSETIKITVSNVNRAPVLNPIGNKTVNETQLLQFTISGSDPDGDNLTFSTINLPPNASFNPATKQFSWTPNMTQSGNYNVTFYVSDGSLNDSEKITITVINTNRPPVIDSYLPSSLMLKLREGYSMQFNQTSHDPDGDLLTYDWFLDAVNKASTPAWLFLPTTAECGPHNATVYVNDASEAVSMKWNVTVWLNGDVDGNRVVNIFDLAAVGLAFGSKPGDATWNVNADISPPPGISGTPEGNGIIDIFDLATVGKNFGRSC